YAQQGYDERGAFTPRDGASRFDCGWLNRGVLAGALASLAFLEAIGPDPYARAAEQAEHGRRLIEAHVALVTAEGQATLVSWESADAAAESRRLAERGVI